MYSVKQWARVSKIGNIGWVAFLLWSVCVNANAQSQQPCGFSEMSARVQVGDNPMMRPTMQASIVVGFVKVHYDTLGINTPALLDEFNQRRPGTAHAYADSVASIANSVLQFETNVLGYLSPPVDSTDDEGPEYDIYVTDLSRAYLGYTMPERALMLTADGGRYTSYIVVDKDFSFISPEPNKGLPALRITLAHEFFHAIQLGSYFYWFREMYYYEMTATWIEDVVFTDVNNYYTYLSSMQGHFRRPDVSFTSGDFIMYGRALWSHYMAKRFGRDAIRRSWELVRDMKPLQALDSTLKESSSSFREAFAEWTKWNAFTGARADTVNYYPEGHNYPEVYELDLQFVPPSQTVLDVLPSLAARYYRVSLQDTILTLALSNINLSTAMAKDETQFSYTYALNVVQLDSTYLSTGTHIFTKLDVGEQENWASQNFVQWQSATSTPAVAEQPVGFELSQNYPNPFNPTTEIRFKVGDLGFVSLRVYNVLGEEIATLLNEVKPSGQYSVSWKAGDAASGVYFYRLTVGTFVETKKMLLLR